MIDEEIFNSLKRLYYENDEQKIAKSILQYGFIEILTKKDEKFLIDNIKEIKKIAKLIYKTYKEKKL